MTFIIPFFENHPDYDAQKSSDIYTLYSRYFHQRMKRTTPFMDSRIAVLNSSQNRDDVYFIASPSFFQKFKRPALKVGSIHYVSQNTYFQLDVQANPATPRAVHEDTTYVFYERLLLPTYTLLERNQKNDDKKQHSSTTRI
ncbi:MAG: hypothetical protein ACMXYF_02845 [Candidatus Woesearchaeota archaeon]